MPEGKLHMKRPLDDKEIPWSALLLGLWIPNFFYWGLNQYITQRTLGSKSLAEGQKGIVFAAFLKLVIPFVVVIPGILAYNLYSNDLKSAAVVKNAKTISAYAPELYESMSDDIKPDADDPLFKNDIKVIAKRVEDARGAEFSKPQLFQFTETFGEEHPEDAQRIVRHNAEALGVTPGEGESALAVNTAMIDKAKVDKLNPKVHDLAIRDFDASFPVLLKNLLIPGSGLLGFVLAAIFGAVVSSLASMLNSASTIATMDLYRKFDPQAPQPRLVTVGRVFVVLFVLIAMLIAPALDDPAFGGIFTFIQEFQGFISPGVLGIFLFGLLVHRAPRSCGIVGLLLSPVLYGLFKFGVMIPGLEDVEWLKWVAERSFLDRMSMTFGLVLATLAVMTLVKPLKQPVDLPVNAEMNLQSSRSAQVGAVVVIALTIVLYIIFW